MIKQIEFWFFWAYCRIFISRREGSKLNSCLKHTQKTRIFSISFFESEPENQKKTSVFQKELFEIQIQHPIFSETHMRCACDFLAEFPHSLFESQHFTKFDNTMMLPGHTNSLKVKATGSCKYLHYILCLVLSIRTSVKIFGVLLGDLNNRVHAAFLTSGFLIYPLFDY